MYSIELSPRAQEHLDPLRKRDQSIILDAIEEHLSHEPEQPTRRRKRLEDNPLAPWELRIGGFRVFYDVNKSDNLVLIAAIGKKTHNRLVIGGEEFDL